MMKSVRDGDIPEPTLFRTSLSVPPQKLVMLLTGVVGRLFQILHLLSENGRN
jgi:hypothetical protein